MTGVRWLDEQEMRAWRSFVTASAALLAKLDRELEAEHGLSLGEYEVLAFLSESPERRRRMTDLADALHLSPSGLTRRLDQLVKQGFVCRQRCDTDKRGYFAVLTDDGYAKLEAAAPVHVRGVREHLIDRLSRRQLDNLGAALRRVDVPEQHGIR
jgi:DNA-binding MarR family transcriptional regulator